MSRSLFVTVLLATLEMSASVYGEPLRGTERIVETLTLTFLPHSSGKPISLGEGRGWRGIVLADTGRPLAHLTSAYDVQGTDETNVALVLDAANLVDRVMLVREGTASPDGRPIADVWDDLLTR